ncbi:MAG: HEAT repeat domain-containing protein [bacterium]
MNKKGNLETASEEIKKIANSGTVKDKKKLIEFLNSESQGVAELAQNAIVNICSGKNSEKKELVKKLMDAASSSSFSIKLRSNSFDTLKQIALQNGNFLMDYAGKNNGRYDRIVAEIIRYGSFTPKNFPKNVLKTLADSGDEITKANAIESIGILKINLGNVLIKALSGNFFVLSAAIFSIGELKLKKAFPKLKEILLNTGDRVIKNIITETLSKIGGDEVTDFLLELLNKNAKYKLDKIYILKSLYKICLLNNCDKDKINTSKEKMYLKLSKMNLKISLFSLNDYEDKDAIDSILCYFSLLNHKKSERLFKFIFEYYQKNENIDETEYGYIKNILSKIARPKHIILYIKSLKQSSDLNNKIDLLIDVLSEISPKDMVNLLDFYKDRKLFVEIKLSLLKYSKKPSVHSYGRLLIGAVINHYIKDGNGDVRKSAVDLLACFNESASYIEEIFNGLLKENYPDVAYAYVETLSNILSLKGNKKYIDFFIGNLSLKNDKAAEYSLKILGNKKLNLTAGEISDLYAGFTALRYAKSLSLKRILAKALKNLDLINHRNETSFLLEEDDEETKLNYLESLLLSGEKNPRVFLDVVNSGNHSDIFRYKIIELIQKLGNKDSFDKLASILKKEKSKMVKIALLRALSIIDKGKSNPILKKYNSSEDKDLRNFSLELIKS